ncbi:MAG: DUF1573 domain-containing protein [Phycisphaerales bacterium]|nr:MAG: DUF1573 domain-containing protein [Phycisphaerales bacterium]
MTVHDSFSGVTAKTVSRCSRSYRLCSALLAGLFLASGTPSSAKPDSGVPVFCVSESNLELGYLAPEQIKLFSLEVANKGDETLIIHSVSSDCGCISQAKKWEDFALEAGRTEEVRFQLLVGSGIRGRMTKAILFKTNDPRNKYVRTTISYTVRFDYSLAALPSKLDFSRIGPESPTSLRLTLVSPYPEPFQVKSIKSSNRRIEIRPVQSNAAGVYILSFEVEMPAKFRPGDISESAEFDTSIGKIIVPIVGYKIDAIESFPPLLVLEPVNVGQTILMDFTIKNTLGKDFRVVRAKAETGELRLKLETRSDPNSLHRLSLEFTPSVASAGPGRSRIHVVTDRFGTKAVDCLYFVNQKKESAHDGKG